jgi:hypothetical protein
MRSGSTIQAGSFTSSRRIFDLDAPVDVRSYGTVNPKFPHESTLDQWFGESRFESYRRLGEYLMDELYERRDKTKLADGAKPTMEQFFNAVTSPAKQ